MAGRETMAEFLERRWREKQHDGQETVARARHFRIDPDFKGTTLPARVGGERWKGKALGFEKYGLPGRIWFGSPAPLKARVGGLPAGVGGLIHEPAEGQQ